MPTVSSFYGILIRMFYNDHPPPHFHARYGEYEATIEIRSMAIIEGELPQRALNLARGAYVRQLGNTPGHVNHWSQRRFERLLARHGRVVAVRSPFPWTMLLVSVTR